ncbi:MAG: hypothetical protein RJA68_836 [Actinomycetota bacterium]
MFAYGVEGLCEKSDLVTGPGNIYVAAAKRALRGVIGIDSEAGPTEIAVLADSSARASDVAADLISQAEHDVIAAAILVTDSIELSESVEAELYTTDPFLYFWHRRYMGSGSVMIPFQPLNFSR